VFHQLKVTDRDKRSSLLRCTNNNSCKNFMIQAPAETRKLRNKLNYCNEDKFQDYSCIHNKRNWHTHTHTHTYIYIWVCECVFVCVCGVCVCVCLYVCIISCYGILGINFILTNRMYYIHDISQTEVFDTVDINNLSVCVHYAGFIHLIGFLWHTSWTGFS
jgi:hypothetical protein